MVGTIGRLAILSIVGSIPTVSAALCPYIASALGTQIYNFLVYRLYSIFDDGTIVTMVGVPQIHFHREAPSLEDAIASALAQVRKAGFDVVRVKIGPLQVFTEKPSAIT